jgi:hypothetical protein
MPWACSVSTIKKDIDSTQILTITTSKPYKSARLEPTFFCSAGSDDDHHSTRLLSQFTITIYVLTIGCHRRRSDRATAAAATGRSGRRTSTSSRRRSCRSGRAASSSSTGPSTRAGPSGASARTPAKRSGQGQSLLYVVLVLLFLLLHLGSTYFFLFFYFCFFSYYLNYLSSSCSFTFFSPTTYLYNFFLYATSSFSFSYFY